MTGSAESDHASADSMLPGRFVTTSTPALSTTVTSPPDPSVHPLKATSAITTAPIFPLTV